MTLDERFAYLVVGLAIGFVVGYITKSLRKIEQKVDHVDQIIQDRDEAGYMRTPRLQDVVLIVILLITVFAAFSSQRASNTVKDNQQSGARTTACTQQYLSKTIRALNQRTTFTTEQAQKNVELQKSQAQFLSIFRQDPPATSAEAEKALSTYFKNLTDFVVVSSKTSQAAQANPYPTDEEFMNCIMDKKDMK